MNKKTELLVPIVYTDQGEKHFLFVIDESKFCPNALGDQRTVLVRMLVFIQSLQLRKSKNCLVVD